MRILILRARGRWGLEMQLIHLRPAQFVTKCDNNPPHFPKLTACFHLHTSWKSLKPQDSPKVENLDLIPWRAEVCHDVLCKGHSETARGIGSGSAPGRPSREPPVVGLFSDHWNTNPSDHLIYRYLPEIPSGNFLHFANLNIFQEVLSSEFSHWTWWIMVDLSSSLCEFTRG